MRSLASLPRRPRWNPVLDLVLIESEAGKSFAGCYMRRSGRPIQTNMGLFLAISKWFKNTVILGFVNVWSGPRRSFQMSISFQVAKLGQHPNI